MAKLISTLLLICYVGIAFADDTDCTSTLYGMHCRTNTGTGNNALSGFMQGYQEGKEKRARREQYQQEQREHAEQLKREQDEAARKKDLDSLDYQIKMEQLKKIRSENGEAPLAKSGT